MLESLRQRGRLTRLKVQNLLESKSGGFFVPYRLAYSVEPPSLYPEIEKELASAEAGFLEILDRIDELGEALLAFRGPPPEPRFDQDWFPRLDAAAAYAMVRKHRPTRIVEIGSGHSTRFLAKALADNGSGGLTCLDPSPRADIAKLSFTEHHARIFGQDDLGLLDELEPNDIVFADSSHIAMPGTDVDLVINRGLRRLRAGVIVHFHDVFLPEGYPDVWAWRGYNEQVMLAALLAGGGYETLFASRYVVTRMAERLSDSVIASLPMPLGAWETSLWLRKR